MYLFLYSSVLLCLIQPTYPKVKKRPDIKDFYMGNVYPWNDSPDKQDSRADTILDDLRENMLIDIKEGVGFVADYLSASPNNELYFTNMEGQRFSAFISDDEGGGNPEGEKSNQKKKGTGKEIIYHVEQLEEILHGKCSYLAADWWTYEWCHRKKIRQFHTNLEIKADVIVDGKLKEKGHHKIVVNPDWSLGEYSRSIIVRTGGDQLNTSAPIIKLVDFYSDGQRCDETQMGRNTEVHIQCCNSNADRNIPAQTQNMEQQRIAQAQAQAQAQAHLQALMQNQNIEVDQTIPLNNFVLPAEGSKRSNLAHSEEGDGDEPYEASIQDISEPEICSYRLNLCVPALCRAKSQPKKKSPGEKAKQEIVEEASLSSILTPIQDTCLGRTEDWWTYEVCLNKGVRQFHMGYSAHREKDGSIQQVATVEASFSLGSAQIVTFNDDRLLTENLMNLPPPKVEEKEGAPDEDRNRNRTLTTAEKIAKLMSIGMAASVEKGQQGQRSTMGTDQKAYVQTQPSLRLEYFGGTPCDIAESGFVPRSSTVELSCGPADAVIDVYEDRTCHYQIKATLHSLCLHPMLAPKVHKNIFINFVPSSPISSEIPTE